MNRLTSTEQFRLAYREGRRASNEFLTLHARRSGLAQSRMGVVVSGRLGGAVARNRIRRRLREAFHAVRDVPPGVDFVVVPRDAVKDAPFTALVGALQELLRRTAGEK